MRVFPFSHSESPNTISHQFHHGDTIRGAVSAACFFFLSSPTAQKRRRLDPCFIPCLLTCCLYVYTYIRGVCISGFYPFFSTTRGEKNMHLIHLCLYLISRECGLNVSRANIITIDRSRRKPIADELTDITPPILAGKKQNVTPLEMNNLCLH